MEERPVDPSAAQALGSGTPPPNDPHVRTAAHVLMPACGCTRSHTRVCTQAPAPESRPVRHLPEFPVIQTHLGDSLLSEPVFCLLPLPKHTHTKTPK